MNPTTAVEIADRYSRKRAALLAIAAAAFLVIHVLLRPFVYAEPRKEIDWWAVTAIVLFGVLATGGGLLNARQIRALVHDDVSRSHVRTASSIGYWVAMVGAMAIYLVPMTRVQTGREAIYVIVTSSLAAALLAFSHFEFRAHAGA